MERKDVKIENSKEYRTKIKIKKSEFQKENKKNPKEISENGISR